MRVEPQIVPDFARPAWMDKFPALNCASSVCQDMWESAEEVQFRKGQWVFREGATCSTYLFCLEGRLRLQKSSPEGREIMLDYLDPGQGCAMSAACLMSGNPYTADIKAVIETKVMVISKANFQRGVSMSSCFREFIFDSYGSQLAILMDLVKDVAFTPLDRRLAECLIAHADSDGVLDITHQTLATALGTVREVITRELKKYKKQGLISLDRGSIQIIDEFALMESLFDRKPISIAV